MNEWSGLVWSGLQVGRIAMEDSVCFWCVKDGGGQENRFSTSWDVLWVFIYMHPSMLIDMMGRQVGT